MNDDALNPERIWSEAGGIGYTLVDDTGLRTNSVVRQFKHREISEGAHVVHRLPQQAASPKRRLSEYAILILVGFLLGFMMHMLVDRIRRRKRTKCSF